MLKEKNFKTCGNAKCQARMLCWSLIWKKSWCVRKRRCRDKCQRQGYRRTWFYYVLLCFIPNKTGSKHSRLQPQSGSKSRSLADQGRLYRSDLQEWHHDQGPDSCQLLIWRAPDKWQVVAQDSNFQGADFTNAVADRCFEVESMKVLK